MLLPPRIEFLLRKLFQNRQCLRPTHHGEQLKLGLIRLLFVVILLPVSPVQAFACRKHSARSVEKLVNVFLGQSESRGFRARNVHLADGDLRDVHFDFAAFSHDVSYAASPTNIPAAANFFAFFSPGSLLLTIIARLVPPICALISATACAVVPDPAKKSTMSAFG